MGDQPGKNMMRVLPHRLRHDQRCVGINAAKNLDALPLAGDEAVSLSGFVRVRTLNRPPLRFQRFGERLLHGLLGGPAGLIGSETQIATGDKLDGFGGAIGHAHASWPGMAQKHKPAPMPILGACLTIFDQPICPAAPQPHAACPSCSCAGP